MHQKEEGKDILSFCTHTSMTGLIIGLVLFILSFFVNDSHTGIVLMYIGLGIMGSSLTFLGFGTIMAIMVPKTSHTYEKDKE